MIYPLTAVWLFALVTCVKITRESGWIGFLIMGPFWGLATALFLEQLRFAFPIRWRKNARWDAFLCSIGSHRCVPICGSRCCWECLRCNPDSPSVKAYFERLERLGIAR